MGKTSFTLEEYEFFLENPCMANFSIDQLNQVIFMHGFNRIWRRPKIDLLNKLRAIELVRPYRSSLEDEEYLDGGELSRCHGDSSASPDLVKRDLEALNWQECHVHSVETVGLAPATAGNSRSGVPSFRESGSRTAVSVPRKDLLASPIARRRRSRKRKWRRLDSIGGGSSVGGEDNYFHCGQEERKGAADIPSAAAGAGAAAGSTSLYVDTYYWEL